MITRPCLAFLGFTLMFPVVHGCGSTAGTTGNQAGTTSAVGGGGTTSGAGTAGSSGAANGGSSGGVAGTAGGGASGAATGGAAGTAGGSAGSSGGGAGGTAGVGIEPECTTHAQCGTTMRCIDEACAPLAQATEACMDSIECVAGTECIALSCTPVGALDQPCTSIGECDDGLICDAETCVDAVMVRFCHCIFFNNGATDASLTLTLDGFEYPPVLSDTCSQCVAFPAGKELDYLITVAGNAMDWTGNYTPGGEQDAVLLLDAAGPASGASPCTEDLTGLCSN